MPFARYPKFLGLACVGLLTNGMDWNRLEAAPPGNSNSWTLVWGDEFSGMSIDAAKWGWGQLPWGGNYHNSSYASVIQASDSYALQTSANLGPVADWSAVGIPPVLTNNQFVVRLPASAGATFYCLKR
jgi:hypothetical protein